ncbi:MAG: adenylate/guanylate cyclase domain-containing protein, partial [Kangiellaceae bacterium]|nr:adenylate/guanylate cyclase domain-containing protein [Kangiellaceae bacterium]
TQIKDKEQELSEKRESRRKLRLFFQWLLLIVASSLLFVFPQWSHVDDLYNDNWRRHIAKESQVDPDIVMIEIDDQSLTALEGHLGKWPWPRTAHTYLVEGLLAAGTKAIVFDTIFAERDIFRPDLDSSFREVLKGQKSVFLAASLLGQDSSVDAVSTDLLPDTLFVSRGEMGERKIQIALPWIIDLEDWNIGLINFLADWDGKARRYPTVSVLGEAGEKDKPSAGSSPNQMKLHSLPGRVVSYLQPSVQFPDEFYLKYNSLEIVPFQSMPYAGAFGLVTSGQELSMFKDKIVVIGATATGLHDLRATPIEALYPATSILATAIDNLKNQEYLKLFDRNLAFLSALFVISLAFLITWLFQGYKVQVLLISFLLLVYAGVLLLMSDFLSGKNILFPAASVFLVALIASASLIFHRGLREYLNKLHTLKTFSRFMDPTIVKQLVADPEWHQQIANKTSEISILFSDIRGFTSLSEKRSAEQIMTILNQYFDSQVEAIFATGGTLDKFIGDAIMAFWGAPIEDPNHAEHAIDAAIRMVENLIEFRKSLPEELQEFDVGIGIHSGDAVVGMLGSAKRFDYTAIGDTINLGSRIEGKTKGIARILVSESTKVLCEKKCPKKFIFEYKGEFAVKGREEEVKLYQPSRRE